MSHPRLIGTAIALCAFFFSSGQTITDSVAIHFRQSKTNLDTAFMGNSEALGRIKQAVELYQTLDTNLILTEINVRGGASPEGSVRFNNWLSRQRAARIFDCVNDLIAIPQGVTRQTFIGRDWHGLRQRVIADTAVPYRDDVVKVLDDIISRCDGGEKDSDANLLLLKRLHGGEPYLYLYRNIFPQLRQADIVLGYITPVKKFYGQPTFIESEIYNPEPYIIVLPGQSIQKPFYIALKTNMLADALALPEIGAEFYLGKNLSIVGNWMYGWWDNDSRHRYWRAYGGDVALRWWFGRAAHDKPLTGHHAGVYGGVVTYDFEFGGRGHMGGRPGHNLWDRCMHYAGIEYGYSLPVARRLNIDFTIGIGYLGGKYVEYDPCGRCYLWEATKQKHWFGPTKAEVSLVWLIGRGNFNKKGAAK